MVTMERWRLVVIAVFYCSFYMAATQHWSKALYPSAYRVKRGTPALINPTFQSSVEDVDLLFEILLTGLHLEGEDGRFGVGDEELASLRRIRALEVVCQDVLPRTLSDIRRLGTRLSRHRGSLRREDFERTVLTMVFTAQQLAHTTAGHQRQLWAETLLQLYRAIKEDLMPQQRR